MYHATNEMIITVSADLHEDPNKIQDLISNITLHQILYWEYIKNAEHF